jgi:hypothetical protein
MISIDAKRKILEKDSEQKMIQIAKVLKNCNFTLKVIKKFNYLIQKKSYMNQIKQRNNVPNSIDLFLTLKIRRKNLITDSLNEVYLIFI